MYRVGIIGSENSHAKAFSKCFNLSGEYDDVKVIGIWGEEPEAGRKLSEECSIPIMTPEEMLGQVDGIMVDPENLRGLTVNEEQAVAFAELLGLNVRKLF